MIINIRHLSHIAMMIVAERLVDLPEVHAYQNQTFITTVKIVVVLKISM